MFEAAAEITDRSNRSDGDPRQDARCTAFYNVYRFRTAARTAARTVPVCLSSRSCAVIPPYLPCRRTI